MNLATLTPVAKSVEKSEKKSVKKHKRSGKSGKKHKRSGKSGKKHKRSGKSGRSGKKRHHPRRNPYEYNIRNQIDQFYKMTLEQLSSEQKGFLNIVDNAIVFNKGGNGTELYLKDLENMPWWTFKLTDVKQKLPIASPLLVGPLTFKMAFKQADKNAEIKRLLSIQNGNVYLVKDHELNLN